MPGDGNTFEIKLVTDESAAGGGTPAPATPTPPSVVAPILPSVPVAPAGPSAAAGVEDLAAVAKTAMAAQQSITAAMLREIEQRYGREAAELAAKTYRVGEEGAAGGAAAVPAVAPTVTTAAGAAAVSTPGPFDAHAQALKQIEAEERRRQIEQERLKILGEMGRLTEKEEPKAFSAEEHARKLLAAEEQRQQILEARERILRERGLLKPEPLDVLPVFDPQHEARQRIDAERRRRQIEAAYLNMTQGPADVIDPSRRPGMLDQSARLAQQAGFGGIARIVQSFDNLFRQVQQSLRTPPSVVTPGRPGAVPTIPAIATPGGGPPRVPSVAAGATSPGGGGTAAGASGLLEAAAPIGAALVVAEIANRTWAAAVSTVNAQVIRFGEKVGMVAENRHWEAMIKTVDDTAETFGKIPIVGQALEQDLKAFTAPVKAATIAVEAFAKRADDLAKFSGPISAAQAQADVRSLMSDIREAQQLGQSYADLIDAQSRASNELRDILLPIKQFFLETLATMMEDVASFLKQNGTEIKVTLVEIQTLVLATLNVLTLQPGQAWDVVKAGLKRIEEILKDAAKKDEKKFYDWDSTINEAIGMVMQGTDKAQVGALPHAMGALNPAAFGGLR